MAMFCDFLGSVAKRAPCPWKKASHNIMTVPLIVGTYVQISGLYEELGTASCDQFPRSDSEVGMAGSTMVGSCGNRQFHAQAV